MEVMVLSTLLELGASFYPSYLTSPILLRILTNADFAHTFL